MGVYFFNRETAECFCWVDWSPSSNLGGSLPHLGGVPIYSYSVARSPERSVRSLLVVRPGAPSSFLLLVVWLGAPSSFLLIYVNLYNDDNIVHVLVPEMLDRFVEFLSTESSSRVNREMFFPWALLCNHSSASPTLQLTLLERKMIKWMAWPLLDDHVPNTKQVVFQFHDDFKECVHRYEETIHPRSKPALPRATKLGPEMYLTVDASECGTSLDNLSRAR